MILKYNYTTAYFLNSLPTIHDLLNSKTSMEIAFTGYSNSGKSSTINTLTQQKKLTKVSRTPGSTKLINLFEIQPSIHLVDFPGYGYTKKTKTKENYWCNIIHQYLKKRKNLKGLVLIADIRYVIKDLDQKIIDHALSCNVPMLILLNKLDKVSKNEAYKILYKTRHKLVSNIISYHDIKIEIFSAIKAFGVESLIKILNCWLV